MSRPCSVPRFAVEESQAHRPLRSTYSAWPFRDPSEPKRCPFLKPTVLGGDFLDTSVKLMGTPDDRLRISTQCFFIALRERQDFLTILGREPKPAKRGINAAGTCEGEIEAGGFSTAASGSPRGMR